MASSINHTPTPDALKDIPQEYLDIMARELQFSLPWQFDPGEGTYRDPDGYSPFPTSEKDDPVVVREYLQNSSWEQAKDNPQANTAIRGLAGRHAGAGFGASSDIKEIQAAIEEIELDPRNRLYNFWPKFVTRSIVEGELFLILTVHDNGFIEVDFCDPASITSDTGAADGIISHPNKPTMPLVYCLKDDTRDIQIPSIFVARYPELITLAKKDKAYQESRIAGKSRKKKFESLGGFTKFIVNWDKSFLTKRNTGHVRTVLKWINRYEELKNFEIDHKKSSGAYVYVIKFTTSIDWLRWLRATEEEKRNTGIMAKKTPGGTLVIGPNMDVDVKNPNLTRISDSDTDILDMITSGLNESGDVTTGNTRGSTFASVKATRAPMSDRVADEVCYFGKFLQFDFWGNIFFLKSQISDFPKEFSVKQVIGFKNGEPVEGVVKKRPEMLIDFEFPTSETGDMEGKAKALLGVKHGSLDGTLGIPKAEIARKLGLGSYRRLRLEHATEEMTYPPLLEYLDQESIQEQNEAEPGNKAVPKKPTAPKVKKKNGGN